MRRGGEVGEEGEGVGVREGDFVVCWLCSSVDFVPSQIFERRRIVVRLILCHRRLCIDQS